MAAGSAAPRGVFVTGTGTEVGKTVVAAVIARTMRARGHEVAVFKPAVSGLADYEGAAVPPDHELLRRAAGSAQDDDAIAPYRYHEPVSPHLGAELAGEPIDPGRVRAALGHARQEGDYLVCEGVGGLLVPLTTGYLVRDVALDAGLPLVVVASPSLGTINHTLLTLEAARGSGLNVAAVVLTPWPAEPGLVERSNRETVAELGAVPVLTLSQIDLGDPASWPELEPPA